MKLIARISALALVATGAFASAHLATSAQPSVSAKVSAFPIPMCPPNDPNACGMTGNGNQSQQ